ncbi:HTH-type transcriptional regulator GltC [compost metagenome]
MDLLHLKYFQTVARTEHITEAAKMLHMAQPALSMIISKLEAELGVPLFDRVGRQIRLNEQGRIYLQRVNAALDSLEEGRRELSAWAGVEEKQVSLAVHSLSELSNVLSPFLKQYPDVQFKIMQASTEEEKLQLLERNEIDFFLTNEMMSTKDVIHVKLATDEMMIAVPPGHRLAGSSRISLTEVTKDGFITLKPGYYHRKLTDEYCRIAGVNPNIVCEGDEPAAICGLIKSGLGIAFLPSRSSVENPALTYLHIDQLDCRITFYLAWKKERYLSQVAQIFREYVIQHFSAI